MADTTYTQVAEQAQAPILTPTPAPNPDMRSLDKLVGTWAVSDPSGNEAIRGTTTYRWAEGGFFLIQDVDLVSSGQNLKGIEVIGHEHTFEAEPSAEIRSRYYDFTSGMTLDYVYEIEGDTLTIWGGQKGSPAYYRGQFSENGNSNIGAWVYPGGGYESSMTRVA